MAVDEIGDTDAVDIRASVDAPCEARRLFDFVDDLTAYPSWVDLVHSAEREPGYVVGLDMPAWTVELRAKVGRFARSKRLRMVRTVHDPANGVVVFERAEIDGRRHSPWVLRAEVEPVPTADGASSSRLRMHLHYGGGLWTGGVLERTLADQIESGRERLVALVVEG